MSSTFDLKTLNLSAGTYEALVKAKGTHYVANVETTDTITSGTAYTLYAGGGLD